MSIFSKTKSDVVSGILIKRCGQFAIFIFVLLLNNFSFGQIKGIYLSDSLTKVPVQYATAQDEGLTFFQTSDENGYINLIDFPQGSNTLTIRCVGFRTEMIELNTLSAQKNEAQIYLTQKITGLSEVLITAPLSDAVFTPISALDIHLRPINNSQEVLRLVPGLFIGQHAGGGKAEQIFLRGFDLDHGTDINIKVDGMPVNMVSHAHGQGYADLHFVIPELIEHVNFNKGPYFADEGNFATAGFVEFNTKEYLDNSFLKLEGGQYSSFRGVFGLNLLKSTKDRINQSLYFAGEGSYSNGYFESPQDFSRFNGVLKYHGSLNKNNSLTATATSFTSKWNASGQIPERAVESGMTGWYGAIDDTEGGHTSRYNLNTELLTRLNNGGTLRNQLFYIRYNFELYSNFTFYKEDSINGDQIRQKEDRNIYGYNGTFQKDNHIGKLNGETQAGIQIRYDDINDLELTRTKDRTINTEQIMLGDVRELNVGTYVSQRIAVRDNFDITGALRFDYFVNNYYDQLIQQDLSSNSIIISPKLNFNYRLNEKVQFYLFNGKGYHSNDTRVAVQQNGRKVLPPAYGSDLGGIFKIGDKLIIQSALWYLWLDQEFVYVGDEGVVEAGGQTMRYGYDLSLRYELAKYIYIDMDYSLCRPEALNTLSSESYLPLAPRITGSGGITYRKQYGWNGSIRYRYMGDRPANETNTVIAAGYFIVDCALNYTEKKWGLGLSIQNLFDTKWKETQFDTESRLPNELTPVSEIHFTPGTPFFAKLSLTINL